MGPETLGCVDPQVVPEPPRSHHHGMGFPEDRVGSSCTHTLEHTHARTDTHVHTLCKWKAEEVEAGPCALHLSLGH